MRLQLARRGRNAGGYFWSCTRFPVCRETREYEGASNGYGSDGTDGGPRQLVPRRVIWADGTLDRTGWTCRYSSVGGSLRAFPESQRVASAVSQCWIARTEAFAGVDPDVERVAGLLKKLIQRGTAPPLDPIAERALLESVGLGDELEPSLMPGDLSVRLRRRVSRPELESAVSWEAPDFEFDDLPFGSDEEEELARSWAPSRIGANAGRWLIPQPSLDGLVTAAGLPAAGERRADFLVTGPGQTAFVLEVDGSQHEDAALVDDDRDVLLEEAGYEVVRVTTSEVRHGNGLGLDEVEGRWSPASSSSGRTYQRLVWAPAQVHRALLALLDGLTVGFLRGDRWVIELDDPLDVVLELLPPYLDLIAAVDRLWGGSVAAREVVLVASDRRRRFVLDDDGYREESSEWISEPQPDLTIRLESDRGPTDRLRRSSDRPEVVVRSSFLPLGVLDPVYEGAGRIAARSEGEQTEWAVRTLLRSVFAKEDFREGQLDALFEVLEGRDCAVLLPTGAGKSLIYQLAGLVLPGRTLVIDPLVALMEDQIEGLHEHGIDRVAAISSFTTMQGMREALLEQVSSGEALFVFVAPERLQQLSFRQALRTVSQTSPINLAVVDEAHCVSEWGHDFRTSYLNLGQTLREVCKDLHGAPPPILALTGTASRAVLRDVLIELGIERDSERSVVRPRSFDRPELRYTIIRAEPQDAPSRLRGFVQSLPARFSVPASDFFRSREERTFSGLVFVPHANGKHGVVDVRRELIGLGPSQPAMYSGGAPKGFENNWQNVKRAHAAAFKANETPLLVSTKAFGMGIDKGNIRYVVHYGIPGSIEGYYQEVGRAGRDRARAECGLVLIEYDEDRARRLLSEDIDFNVARQEHEKVSWGDADDITRQLWFFFNSFRGVDAELDALRRLLADINAVGELGRRQSISVPMGEPAKAEDRDRVRQERERALHRLVLLGVVRDYLVEWGARQFSIELVNIDSEGVVQRLLDYVRRNQPGRVEAIRAKAEPAGAKPLDEAVVDCARILIEFVYDTVARSRLRSLREMWLAARETQNDPNGAFRQRILDYLSQGAIAPTLERLVDRARFTYSDWIDELSQIVDVDDAREMRGDSARILASYPDHPGLLLARALSETLDDRGDLREFASNLESSLKSARERYGATESDLDEFGRWLLSYAAERRQGTLAVALAALRRSGVSLAAVREVEASSLRNPDADPGIRVVALAGLLENSAEALTQAVDRYQGVRT
jgi:ATP-dependent DNA helicase RecQ